MTSAKVRHVLAALPDGKHTCHWPGCKTIVPPAMWGCRLHWYRLTRKLREKIWAAYRPGQETDKHPSVQYLEAAKEAQEYAIRWNASHGISGAKSS